MHVREVIEPQTSRRGDCSHASSVEAFGMLKHTRLSSDTRAWSCVKTSCGRDRVHAPSARVSLEETRGNSSHARACSKQHAAGVTWTSCLYSKCYFAGSNHD